MNNSSVNDYESFVASKRRDEVATGHNPSDLNENLFDFQNAIVTWACRRGRAAIFADTGLGKTLMQLSWADQIAAHTNGIVVILAPLAVSEQTIEQGKTFGIEVSRIPHDGHPSSPGIWITNYERMDSINFGDLKGIVLDESSILKSHNGKTRTKIIESCQSVPYRLSCTATPSPNDFEELGNQCEFLGVMTRTEMLATYFVNDTGDTGTWRLKGWGASKFWEWMGSWAVVLRNPSDIGFDGSRYELPPIKYFEHVVESEQLGDELFAKPAMTMLERRKAQRSSIEARCNALAAIVNAEPNEPWLIWCHLNDEADLLEKLIGRSVNVQGSDSDDFKTDSILWFSGKKCVCENKSFSTKLASWKHQYKTQTIKKSTTQRTEKSVLLSLSSTNKTTRKVEKITCANIQNQTLKNLSELQNNNQRSIESAEKSTQSAQTQEIEQSKKLRIGNPPIQTQDSINECGDTASLEMTTTECLMSKMDVAKYAAVRTMAINEEEDSTLTTVTNLELLEDSYAPTAIKELEDSTTMQDCLIMPLCTCGAQRGNQVLISKARMFGYGLNMQHCARMAFVGLDDSFEKFYQAVRRCHRFGQKRNVHVHIFTAENEGQILENIKRKEVLHNEMSIKMIDHMKEIMSNELSGQENIVEEYREDKYEQENFTVLLGDCVKHSRKMQDNSIDYSVFSPPFADLFVYSNSDHDMGNCKNDGEFVAQLRFLISELFRVLKPGRNVSFHCMNLPTTKMRQGFIGLRDFRGDLIRAFQDAGFIYHSEVAIWKNPVVAMQRTKALGLLHKTIRENGTMSRMGLPDYVVTMRKPGDCDVCVTHGDDLPVALWQKYASPIWTDINQSRTLNKLPARDDNDEKHMCPLQLDVIERCIHLWTNPGDLIFSPFTGIGSEGYCAVKMGRKFIGTELKPQYYELACQNIKDAEIEQHGLFS
jgi:DNA modification methylase